MLTPPKLSMSTLPVTLPVDLSELDNKETLFVKKRETNDAEVSEEVVWFLKVARELQEPRSLVLPPPRLSMSTLSIASSVDPFEGANKALVQPPPESSMSISSITAPVDLSEGDNKEAPTVKREVETDDAEVPEEVVVKVARVVGPIINGHQADSRVHCRVVNYYFSHEKVKEGTTRSHYLIAYL